MDKTIRILLATGIAILFPVLIYFAAVTVYPTPKNPSVPAYPDAPSQPDCYYSYNYSTDTSGSDSLSCQKQEAAYQRDLNTYDQKQSQYTQDQKDYEAKLKNNDKITLSDRGDIAIIIAVVAIGLTVAIRDIKELAGGIVVGSTLTIIVAISSIISYMGTDKITGLSVGLIALSFAVLSVVLYFLDRALPVGIVVPKIVAHPATAPAAHMPELPVPPTDQTK